MDELLDEPLVAMRLTVFGSRFRFTYLPPGVTVSEDAIPGTTLTYQDLNCLLPLQGEHIELDPTGDVAEASGLPIELVTDDDEARDYDVSTVDEALAHVGAVLALLPTGADWQALILADVAADDTTLYVDRDVSGYSYPRLVYVGHEAMWATAAAGSVADPEDADPFRVTVARGVAGTNAIAYTATPELADYPVLYSDMVAWRRRPALLEEAPIWGIPGQSAMVPDDGWSERRRGFIEDTPDPGEVSLVLRLHPNSSKLDTEAEVNPTLMGLAQGVHYFQGANGRAFEWAVRTDRVDLRSLEMATAADSNSLPCQVDYHAEAFDVSLPQAPYHPRLGRVRLANSARSYWPTGYTNPGLGVVIMGERLDIATGPARAAAAGTEVTAVPCLELKRATVAEGLADWPADFISAVNAVTADTTQGFAGAHASLQIVPDGVDGWGAAINSQLEDTPAPLPPEVILWDPHGFDEVLFSLHGLAPIPWKQSREFLPEPAYTWASDGTRKRRALRVAQLLAYPVRYRRPAGGRQNSVGIEVRGDGAHWLRLSSALRQPYRRVFEFPSAFYQVGEPGVLVDTEVPTPAPGERGSFTVQWSEPGFEQRLAQSVEYTDVDEVILADGSSAWYLTLVDPYLIRSFGDWPGLEPARIELNALAGTGSDLLIRLFSQYLGFGDAELDLASFRRFPDPPGLIFNEPRTGTETVELREIAHGLLVATNTAIVPRTDSLGRDRLTRVSVGLETAVESVMHITDDDMVEPPTYDAERNTINRVVIRANFDADGDPGLVQTYHLRGAAAESGGDAGTFELDLRGVNAVRPRHLQHIAARIFALRGRPRRLWHCAVPLGTGRQLHAGAVIQVTSSYLRAYGKGVGITGLYGRIRRIEMNDSEGVARLTVVHHGAKGTGWNTSLRITAVPSATELDVDGGDWHPTEHPVTGAPFDPFTLWSEGYSARIVPHANHDAGPTLGITTITSTGPGTARILFDGNHNIAGGPGPFGEVEPPAYDLACPQQQQLAYLSDDAGTLGAAAVPGFQAV